MHVMSWNTQGRMKALPEQLQAVMERQPDFVALQEVQRRTVAQWRAGLQQHGLAFSAESVTCAETHGRTYGQLIASRWPITQLPWMDVPYQERVLSVRVATPWGSIELHNTHVPNSDKYGWIKVETFEGIYKQLAYTAAMPRILCGDFNSPYAEREDGSLVTLGQQVRADGRAVVWDTWTDKAGRTDTGMRWDRAERSVLTGLAAYDLVDVYRACNGYAVQGCSWWWTGQGKTVGRRFDHIFAARALNVAACDYLPMFYTNGLSDHAPIEACFNPEPTAMRDSCALLCSGESARSE